MGLVKILISCCVVSSACLLANPEGANVVSGDVSISSMDPATLNISASDKSIINWNSFSIKANETTNFLMPNSEASVLNRVVGIDPSSLMGSLNSNGNVILINPNGIIVSKEGCINTASFIASSFDILNEDFLNGNQLLFSGTSNNGVINLGKISASTGDVFLIGYQVKNEGDIQANGVAGIGVGREVLLKPKDNEKITIRGHLSDSMVEKGIENSGSIKANQVELKADGNLYSLAINNTGKIDAFGKTEKNGRVFLVAENGRTVTQGTITAKNDDNTGGEIHILGKEVGVFDNAIVDASGDVGGGEVLIGGDYQGNNPDIINAKGTYIAKTALINADANMQGNGGKIIVWGNELNGFYGTALARGGQIEGDGGFIEISSPLGLIYSPTLVSTLAVNGKTGMLLLDPCDINITAGISSPAFPAGTLIYPSTAFSGTATLNATDLVTNGLNTNNVTVTTANPRSGGSGIITVTAPISWNNATTLTLNADEIDIKGIEIKPLHINGNIILTSSGLIKIEGTATTADITTLGGSLTINCTDLTLQAGTVLNSAAFINVPGNISGSISNTLNLNANINGQAFIAGSNITLSLNGLATLTGSGSFEALILANNDLTFNSLASPGGSLDLLPNSHIQ
ncbi:MAG: filamentous hemagglutinin N-terminal domain-containing protein [Chlamydiae bacterium]|nr:filamentous hemagglutinin N-terminal domain-containing protein [Chlamydiota bacterium]